jgi:valyl-tRNA synthetase
VGRANSTLSDEELVRRKTRKLYFIQYKIEGVKTFWQLQQRVQLFFGDSAICINPNDERFAHLKEKSDSLFGRVILLLKTNM